MGVFKRFLCLVLFLQFTVVYNSARPGPEAINKVNNDIKSVIKPNEMSNTNNGAKLADVLKLVKWTIRSEVMEGVADLNEINSELRDLYDDYAYVDNQGSLVDQLEKEDTKSKNIIQNRKKGRETKDIQSSGDQISWRFSPKPKSVEKRRTGVVKENNVNLTATGDQVDSDKDIDSDNMVTELKNLAVKKRPFGVASSCTMDTIETGLTFSQSMDTSGGTVLLVCRGNVLVNKCEGMCHSNVNPSVNHYDGYEKVCSCCRDSSTRQRDVTLTLCSIGETEVAGHFLTRTIIEPASCSCLECS